MKYNLRRMNEDDIPFLTSIVSENYSKFFAEQFVNEANFALNKLPFKPNFIVIENQDKILGCACWNSNWCSWGVFNISWVQVKKHFQNIGIGKLLVNKCLEELKPQAGLIILSTSSPDYYSKNWGFKILQQYRGNEGENYILMSLEVK